MHVTMNKTDTTCADIRVHCALFINVEMGVRILWFLHSLLIYDRLATEAGTFRLENTIVSSQKQNMQNAVDEEEEREKRKRNRKTALTTHAASIEAINLKRRSGQSNINVDGTEIRLLCTI